MDKVLLIGEPMELLLAEEEGALSDVTHFRARDERSSRACKARTVSQVHDAPRQRSAGGANSQIHE